MGDGGGGEEKEGAEKEERRRREGKEERRKEGWRGYSSSIEVVMDSHATRDQSVASYLNCGINSCPYLWKHRKNDLKNKLRRQHILSETELTDHMKFIVEQRATLWLVWWEEGRERMEEREAAL